MENAFQTMSHESAVRAVMENKQILINYAPGTGKSRISLLILDEVFKLNPKAMVMIVCSSANARDNTWPAQFREWGYERFLTQVKFVLYTELNAILFKSYDMVIADEIHKITPRAFGFFSGNYIRKAVLLTGTMPDKQLKYDMIMKLSKGIAINMSMEHAIEHKVVNPFQITVIEVMPYEQEYQWYLKSCSTMMSDKVSRDISIRQRMHEIYNLQAKADVAKWLVAQLEVLKKRVLVYCANKAQANQICDYQYHSGTDESAMVKFLANEILSMAVVGMLNDNANIPDLAYGIMAQVYGESSNLLQKIGRFQRVMDKNTISKLYLLKAMRTQDEVWVYKALKPISENRIRIVTWERLLQMGYQPKQTTI